VVERVGDWEDREVESMFTQRARTHVIDSMIWMSRDSVMKSKLVSTGYVKVSMHCMVEGRIFLSLF